MTGETEDATDHPARARHQVAIAAVGLATVVTSATVTIHAFDPVYAIPTGLAVAVVVAAVSSIVAATVAIRAVRPDLAVLAALATFLLLFTLVAILSIGIVALPFAVFALVVTAQRASSAGREGRPASAVLAGAVMALGLGFASLLAIQDPLVRCGPGGSASTSTPLWWSGSSSSAGSSSTPASDGTFTQEGVIRVGDHIARFECQDGEVTRFEVD